MKKTTSTLLSAALAALMLTGCTARNEVTNGSKVTASPDVAQTQTTEPTAEPTALPTEAPSQEPNPYCMEEYEQLLKFFEIADENGVKNGEKCFKDYDPSRVEFWGTEQENNTDSVLTWDENGYLRYFYLCNIGREPIQLAGELRMIGFGALEGIGNYEDVTLESAYIRSYSGFYKTDVTASTEVFICAEGFEDFNVSSSCHCHFEITGYQAEYDGDQVVSVDLTSEGSGSVGTSRCADEHYRCVYVYAEPAEGHKFIGWYDAEGNLISEKAVIKIAFDDEIDEDDVAYIFDRNFTGTAKFE